jgi:hypothetical protein
MDFRKNAGITNIFQENCRLESENDRIENKRNSRTAKREIISERKTSSTQENRWKLQQLSREKSAILENAETKNPENKKN